MGLLTAERLSYGFAGHETFAFRYGWLKKGLDAVTDDPLAFSRDSALAVLGVGKNMVRSIRYWCLATQVIEEDRSGGRRTVSFRPTDLGTRLLGDAGWDPYLEDPASLWLVHWLLVSNPKRAATWHLGFNRFPHPSFTRRDLLEFIQPLAERSGLKTAKHTLIRDIECFVRTYVPLRSGAAVAEDTFDCPLAELRLIDCVGVGDVYRFNICQKTTLPVAVFAVAFSTYCKSASGGSRTLSLGDCQYGLGSPGQVFKLDEDSLTSYLEELGEATGKRIQLDETAGLRQVYLKRPYDPLMLLGQYYGR